ncbi:MAG: 2OG-Fe(II) oxygenase [Gammaproteobacteria bacterium]|nr:2OG-Fe(II) oxygenase [Gammaproteobacteria bacterium]
MSSVNNDLINILSKVQRPGDFYISGTREIFTPRLEIEEIGQISFPLQTAQTEQIINAGEYAPYGKGEETLVDTDVRRTWQINKEQISLSGKHWEQDLNSIVEQVKIGLGVSGEVEADLYKLLVYDEGSFFVPHRDTEKASGMFATLVIVLPSNYSGGELVVRHGEQVVTLNMHRDEPSELAFAAFYADCVHEVLPITQGCRLTLIYNLLRRGKKTLPKPPNYQREQEQVTKLLRHWTSTLVAARKLSHKEKIKTSDTKEHPIPFIPEKLIYLLEHAYTPEGLAFEALKNADAAIADALVEGAQQADCEIYLALVTIEESGSAEYDGYGGYYSEVDENDFAIGEVYDRSETVSEWQSPDGTAVPIAALPFDEGELCPENVFEEMEPDEVEFQEATGNEGASFERTYRRAALVIWPKSQKLAVLNQAGHSVTLPFLSDLSQRWQDSGADFDSPLWQDAHKLAGYMLDDWPKGRSYYYNQNRSYQSSGNRSSITKFLTYLHRLKDIVHIDTAITDICASENYQSDTNNALVQAAELLPLPRTLTLLEQIISSNTTSNPGTCTQLLFEFSSADFISAHTKQLIPAATSLLKNLPGDPERSSQNNYGQSNTVDDVLVIELINALINIDTTLVEDAVNYILSWPKTYSMDQVLVPSAVHFCQQKISLPKLQPLYVSVQTHLSNRITQMIDPPSDWKRASKLSCSCKDCKALSQFLASPSEKVWHFKAAENKRSHLHGTIRSNKCDVNCTTSKKGRPYTLVCVKNQASYDRRAKQHQKDLENIGHIET